MSRWPRFWVGFASFPVPIRAGVATVPGAGGDIAVCPILIPAGGTRCSRGHPVSAGMPPGMSGDESPSLGGMKRLPLSLPWGPVVKYPRCRWLRPHRLGLST